MSCVKLGKIDKSATFHPAYNEPMVYVRLAVNLPSVSGIYDYSVPEHLEPQVMPGCLVTVPFGKQVVQGVVLELVSQPAVAETKTVMDLFDPLPVLTTSQVSLAKWLAWETLSPLAACIGLMIPAGVSQQVDVLYSIHSPQPGLNRPQFTSTQTRLFELVQKSGNLRGRQIDRHFENVDWRKSAEVLVKRMGICPGSPSFRPLRFGPSISERPSFPYLLALPRQPCLPSERPPQRLRADRQPCVSWSVNLGM